MNDYKKKFIQFLLDEKALLFGEFVTKSGRVSPYFINTGLFHNGKNINKLGYFYAAHLKENYPRANCVFGPAYKGIPLAVTTAISMGEHYGAEMDYCFNRKEIKDHAESGLMVGKKLNPNDRVVLIDDVVTAGLSIEESIAILKSQGNPDIVGVIIAVDRMEKSNDGDNVIQKIKDKNGLSIKPIVSIEEVLKTVEEMHLLSKGEWEKIYAYRYRYGV